MKQPLPDKLTLAACQDHDWRSTDRHDTLCERTAGLSHGFGQVPTMIYHRLLYLRNGCSLVWWGDKDQPEIAVSKANVSIITSRGFRSLVSLIAQIARTLILPLAPGHLQRLLLWSIADVPLFGPSWASS